MVGKIIDMVDSILRIKMDGKVLMTVGATVNVSPVKVTRSLRQNGFYWAYLDYVISQPRAKELGHFSRDALHSDIKAYIKDAHQMDFPDFYSTADLTKQEFRAFFDIVDFEIMSECLQIDTSEFDATYHDYRNYIKNDPEISFRDFLSLKKS